MTATDDQKVDLISPFAAILHGHHSRNTQGEEHAAYLMVFTLHSLLILFNKAISNRVLVYMDAVDCQHSGLANIDYFRQW